MNKRKIAFGVGIILVHLLNGCSAQTSSENHSLQFITAIAMPDVGGRIDHLAYDSIHQLVFVAALGNNTVEVADLKTGKIIHTIIDLDEPQGIAVIPESNSLFVATGGEGVCVVYNTGTFQKTASLKLDDDADNVRYDPAGKKIYVGHGSGGIAVIDPGTFKLIKDVKVEAHPESFQLDKPAGRIYVNVPDEQLVEIIDISENIVVSSWKITEAKSNFPMALDVTGHRLFIGCRHPAKLLIVDTQSGKTISSLDIDSDVDDIFYDQRSAQLFLSCGGGYVDVFKETSEKGFVSNGNIKTQPGARTCLFIPELNRLIVASPSAIDRKAQLLIYQVN